MYRLSATFRIAIGMTLLSSSVLLVARSLRIGPDEDLALLTGRRDVAATVALHCSFLLNRNELNPLQQSLRAFVDHHPEVRSIALRKPGGELVLSAESDRARSVHSSAPRDDSTAVSLPLLAGEREWGSVDVQFEPLRGGGLLAMARHPYLQLLVATTLSNLLLFLLYLKRTLQHLDPSRVVPDRVRNAFDTIAEGLVVLDSYGRIVLANKAFAAAVRASGSDLVGRSLARFHWQDDTGTPLGNGGPWQATLQDGVVRSGITVRLAGEQAEEIRCYVVNASPIVADDGSRRGMLATFEDVTELEKRREELKRTMDVLRASRDEVRKQNDELRLLATRDPLTGCQNRRSFYEALETHWNASRRHGHSLGFLMVDLDHFKAINDNHGHSTGDVVLQKMSAVLKSSVRNCDLLCRYGGEEFCVLMPDVTLDQAAAGAEHLRRAIESLVVPGISVTASLGVTCSALGAANAQELIDQADKSLYVAKHRGRNRVERFAPERPDFAEALAAHDGRGGSESAALQEHVDIPYHAVSALISALSFRDVHTAEHARRVADLCVALAPDIMSARERYILETAALLHDIGKIGVPDSILLKPGPLTADEWKIMGVHDRMGVEIIASAFACPSLNEIVENHHAWFGGNPRQPGLPSGERIPFGARILAIADAYDAIVSDRVYRKGRNQEAAFQELRRCVGTQFDPALVERLVSVVGDQPQVRERTVDDVSRHAAVLVGQRMERLAHLLDTQDLQGLSVLAKHLHQTAQQHQIPDLANIAVELEQAARAESDLQTIADLTNELLDLCRATQSALIKNTTADAREICYNATTRPLSSEAFVC